jgi:hypothetical protein
LFRLKDPLIASDNHYYKAFVQSVDIPYSFKTINNGNNVLNISVQYDGNAPVVGTITIAPGNYSIISLLTELEIELKAYCFAIQPNHVPNFPSTYDRDTGHATLLIQHTSGQSWTVLINWWDGDSDLLAPFFGFDPSLNQPNFTTSLYGDNSGSVYINNVSLYNVNCSPITSLYLRSTSLAQESNNMEMLVSSDDSVSDIILKIPIATFSGSWVLYENGLNWGVRLRNKQISEIDFYITDGQTYTPLLLANVHWKIHLLIQEIKPDWVSELESLQMERDKQMMELQNMRESLITDLQDGAGSLRETVQPQIEEEKNIEDMKNDLMNEIDQNRVRLKTDFYNPDNI